MSFDHADICTFCEELSGESSPFLDLGLAKSLDDYVLYESQYFSVVPCLGPLADWYVLIVSKRHTLSSGWMSEAERADLRVTIREVRDRVRAVSGQDVVIFEHGSYDFRNKGGSCQDHAHLHVVATDKKIENLVSIVSADVELREVEDWLTTAKEMVADEKRSYLAIETSKGSFVASATGAPSQFFRRALCRWFDEDPDGWDWLVYPNSSRLATMLQKRLDLPALQSAE